MERAVHNNVMGGQELWQQDATVIGQNLAQMGIAVIGVELNNVCGVNGRTHRGNSALGKYLDVMNSMGFKCGDSSSCRRTKTNDDCAASRAVETRRTNQTQGVQYGGIAGKLVIQVENMQAEVTFGSPVIHRLESNQRKPPVNRRLGHFIILDAVRPAPQNMPLWEFSYLGCLRLWKK